MAPSMKIVFGLLTFVTVGMIIGALSQLAFIRKLEDSYGLPFWNDDKEAEILRLGYAKPEVLSWPPRIILLHNFLSMEECDYLRAIALPRLHVSTVVDAKTGKGIKSDVRTSSGMFLSAEERKYPMIQAIEKRISSYSQVPVENGELMQVLRFEKNQYYKPRHDYFSDTFNLKRGGQRIATMLMYLSDNVEGGETFPNGHVWVIILGSSWDKRMLVMMNAKLEDAPKWCVIILQKLATEVGELIHATVGGKLCKDFPLNQLKEMHCWSGVWDWMDSQVQAVCMEGVRFCLVGSGRPPSG